MFNYYFAFRFYASSIFAYFANSEFSLSNYNYGGLEKYNIIKFYNCYSLYLDPYDCLYLNYHDLSRVNKSCSFLRANRQRPLRVRRLLRVSILIRSGSLRPSRVILLIYSLISRTTKSSMIKENR